MNESNDRRYVFDCPHCGTHNAREVTKVGDQAHVFHCDNCSQTWTESNEAASLSRLLYQARESLEMWADVVERRAGKPDPYTRGLVAQIDAYRAEKGWPANGWGGES